MVDKAVDDFEYYLTFPEVVEASELGTSKEPVVVLFGWAGCLDKYLVKYSEIYTKKGCTCIRYIASPNVVSPRVINEKKLKLLSKNVVSLLLDMKFESQPIFFHIFSNGGGTVYRYVSDYIRRKHPGVFKIRGCIFDSSPARVRPLGFFRAALATEEISYLAAFCALLRAFLFGIYSSLLAKITGRHNYFRLWYALLEEPNVCSQLFIFSKKDHVCEWDTIQQFADARKRKGVPVRTLLFEDSEHVRHMPAHKEEYVTAVYSFMDENIRDSVHDNCDMERNDFEAATAVGNETSDTEVSKKSN